MGKGITDEQAEELIADWRSRGLEIEVRGHAIATEKPRAQPKPPAIVPSLPSPGYALWIPEWFPALANQLVGRHWRKPARLKREDKETVQLYFARSGIPPAEMRRRVDLHFIVPPKRRRWDADAPWKSTLDALKACGAIREDSDRWCRVGLVYWSRAMSEAWGTQILLMDV